MKKEPSWHRAKAVLQTVDKRYYKKQFAQKKQSLSHLTVTARESPLAISARLGATEGLFSSFCWLRLLWSTLSSGRLTPSAFSVSFSA